MADERYGITGDQRKGVLLGTLVSAAIHGMSGSNPLVGGAHAYGKGITSLYDEKKRMLDAERMDELINASKMASQLSQKRFGLEEERLGLQKEQFDIAKSKPWGTIEVGAGSGRMQRGTYGSEGFTPMGEPYLRFNPASGAGDAVTDYRIFLKMAQGEALKGMKFNKPNQLALLQAMIDNPAQAGELSVRLSQTMTPEQEQEYERLVRQYFNQYAPNTVLQTYKDIRSRTPETKVIDDVTYIKKGDKWYAVKGSN